MVPGGLPEPALSVSSTSDQSNNAAAGAPSAALVAAVQLAAAASAAPAKQAAGDAASMTTPSDTPSNPANACQDTAANLAPACPERELVLLPQDGIPTAPRRRWASLTEEDPYSISTLAALGLETSQDEELPWSGARSRHGSFSSPKSSFLQTPLVFGPAPGADTKPGPSPALRPREGFSGLPNFAPARRRWASISDDEASPMIWPMKSPMRRAINAPFVGAAVRSPVAGPATRPGASLASAAGLAQTAARSTPPGSPFLLPAGMSGAPVAQTAQPTPLMPPGFGLPVQMAAAQPQMARAPRAVWSGGAASAAPVSYVSASTSGEVSAQPQSQRTARTLNGWTAIWVGERAFRAPPGMKEQIESIGFMVKVYRSHVKCCRALDNKAHLPTTTVYVVSEADAEAVLAYLCRRECSDLRFVVEASSAPEAQAVAARLNCPEDAILTVAGSWDEVVNALRAVAAEASSRLPAEPPSAPDYSAAMPTAVPTAPSMQLATGPVSWAQATAPGAAAPGAAPGRPTGMSTLELTAAANAQLVVGPRTWAQAAAPVAPATGGAVRSGAELATVGQVSGVPLAAGQWVLPQAAPQAGEASSIASNGTAAVGAADSVVGQVVDGNPWTLVWISDQAFKPSAVAMKAQLETLGGQVKGYKTHKNAARALDKKRALTRTVVLVSGTEAPPFLAYLSSRPELASTRVVVEASSRSVPIRETPTCEVADTFDAALVAVSRIVRDPGFA